MWRKSIFIICYILTFLFLVNENSGYPSGIAGYTLKTNSSGCGACHSTHSGVSTLVQVVIDGPLALLPGETGFYTLTISGGNGNDV